MSVSVDKRVVEMEFKNDQFIRRASETLQAVKLLKNSLNFAGIGNSVRSNFNEVAKASSTINTSFNGVAESVSALERRFSIMGIVGMTVITRLTNGVLNLGRKLTRMALSGGWQRALNIQQARFQIEGLKKDWESLSEDIDYAVKGTAYGFDEAARAASQLAASQVKAGDDMKAALRGISGVAAMTNSSYTDISEVFTRVAGQGRLMSNDLNSLAARGLNVAATLGDALGHTEAEIRDMVTKGQIDFKTFSKAMDDAFGEHATEADKMFTGAMSNVRAALSRIGALFATPLIEISDFNDKVWNLTDILVSVKLAFNALQKVIENSKFLKAYEKNVTSASKAISKFIRNFIEFEKNEKGETTNKAAGFRNLPEVFSDISKTITLLWKNIKQIGILIINSIRVVSAYINVIFKQISKVIGLNPHTFLESVNKILKKTSKYLKRLNFGFVAKNIKGVIKFRPIVHKALVNLKKMLVQVKKVLSGLISVVKYIAEVISIIIKGLKDLVSELINSIKNSERFQSAIRTLANAFSKVKEVVAEIIEFFKNGFSDFKDSLADRFEDIKSGVIELKDRISSLFKKTNDNGVNEQLSTTDKMLSKLSTASDTLRKKIATLYGVDVESYLKNTNGELEKTEGILSKFAGATGKTLVIFTDALTDALRSGDLTRILSLFNISALASMALAARKFFKKLTSIVSGGVIESVIAVMDSFRACLMAYQSTLKADALMTVAKAIALLVGAVFLLSMIDPQKLSMAIMAISILFAEISFAFKGLLKQLAVVGPKVAANLTAAGIAIMSFSVAILVLSTAMKILSTIDPVEMGMALISMLALIYSMVQATKALSDSKRKVTRAARSILVFSLALNLMAIAVKQLGKLSVEDLIKGVSAIEVLMATTGIFLNMFENKSKFGPRAATGLLIISAAMIVLSKAVQGFASMDVPQLAKGIVSVTVLLLSLSAALKVLSGTKNALTSSAGIFIISAAMERLAGVVLVLSKMSNEEIARGFIAITTSLYSMVIALSILKSGIRGAIALMILSKSLETLLSVFTSTGKMSWISIGKALTAIAGGLVIMVGALMLLKRGLKSAVALYILANAIETLAPALVMLGKMSWEEIGKAMLTIASSITILGLAALILKPLTLSLFSLSIAMNLFGLAVMAIGAGFNLFVGGLIALGAVTGAQMGSIKEAIIGLSETIPVILQAVGEGIVELLKVLADQAPAIIDAGVKLILALLVGIEQNIYKIVNVAVDIVVRFVAAIADNLDKIVDVAFYLIVKFVDALADAIVENTPKLVAAMANLMWALSYAVVEILRSFLGSLPVVGDQIDEWLSGVEDDIKDRMDSNKSKIYGEDWTEGVSEGIESGSGDVKQASTDMADEASEGADASDGFKTSGENSVLGWISGFNSHRDEAVQAAVDLATESDGALRRNLDEHSPSKVFAEIGKFATLGFVVGMTSINSKVRGASKSIADESVKTMQTAIKAINDIASNDWSQPTIRPVLDLSEIQNGGGRISAMLNGASLSLGSSVLNARKINAELDRSAAITMANEENLIASQNRVVTALDDLTRLTEQNKLDIDQIYDAVRIGASNATVSVPLNGRELSRGLRDMGVAFK